MTETYVFAADVNSLIDQPPEDIVRFRMQTIGDCMALGADPERTTIFLQSSIEPEIAQITNRLGTCAITADLLATPNIQAKMDKAVLRGESDSNNPTQASFGLLGYPVLMAADIFAQKADMVAVGADQEPHLAIARSITQCFNARFNTEILIEPASIPSSLQIIMRLNGGGKMSKTLPDQGVVLTDNPKYAKEKIQNAYFPGPGSWDQTATSHFEVAARMSRSPRDLNLMRKMRQEHMGGTNVREDFLTLWANITEKFLSEYQERRSLITNDDIKEALAAGSIRAKENATLVLEEIKTVTGI